MREKNRDDVQVDYKQIDWINSKFLKVDPTTKRRGYDSAILEKLRQDIIEFGFRPEHPLVVRPNPKKKGHWLITCGQHRFEAGLKAGIGTFPCVKRRRQEDIYALSEAYRDNVLSCPVDAITEAEYFHKVGMEILKERGHDAKGASALKRRYPEEQIALQMGVTKNYVKHRLPLLQLPKVVQFMVRRYYMTSQRGYKISPSIGEELARLQRLLCMQNEADPRREIDVEKAVREMAINCWNDRLSRHALRKIIVDIQYQGYNEWKDKEPIEKDEIKCIICGKEARDNPWVALCPEHKQEILAYASSLESDSLESFKGASALNDSPSSQNNIRSKGNRGASAPNAPKLRRIKPRFRLKHLREDRRST